MRQGTLGTVLRETTSILFVHVESAVDSTLSRLAQIARNIPLAARLLKTFSWHRLPALDLEYSIAVAKRLLRQRASFAARNLCC